MGKSVDRREIGGSLRFREHYKKRSVMDFQTLQLVTTIILFLALVVATWQTVLTRRSVASQKKNFELDASPWLTGSQLKPEVAKDDPMQMQLDAYLTIKNVGKTPAIAVSINSQYTILEEGKASQLYGGVSHENITIAPEDECHVQLCRLEFDDPRQRARINTIITYSTFFGGKGEVGLSFIQDDNTGWSNGPTTYKFTDSDDKEYGEPPRLPKLGQTFVIPKGSIQEESGS